MKRIILFLALLSLGVSKAQVVGGYLPLNSTKSATMGGLRVNGNETVTGTFSVGSTATITGALKASSTMSLGSANLTGGNTGTVAVLSDAVFCTQSNHKPYDAPDGVTVYYANSGYLGMTTNTTYNRIYVPKNCTLIGYDILGYVDGGAGSAESSTLSVRVDNTTDILLSSSITYTGSFQQWHSMGLSSDINANSYFNLKWVTPTWANNPTQIINSVVLWFKLR